MGVWLVGPVEAVQEEAVMKSDVYWSTTRK